MKALTLKSYCLQPSIASLSPNCARLTLRGLREKCGMSQREFADYLDSDQKTVFRRETKMHEAYFSIKEIKKLEKLLHAFGLKFQDLEGD